MKPRKPRPPGETRSDRFRKFLVGVGVAIILVSLPTIVYQQYQNNRSQNNHHTATAKQQNQIIALEMENLTKDTAIRTAQKQNKSILLEVDGLQKQQVAELLVINSLKPVDTYLQHLAIAFIEQTQNVCKEIRGCVPVAIPTS